MLTPTNPPDPARQSAEERARDLYRSLQVPVVTDLDARLRVSQDARDKLAKIEAVIRAAHAEGRQAGLEEAADMIIRAAGRDPIPEAFAADMAMALRSTPPPPCTCGSGGHPRKCAAHPGAYDRHVAEIDAENRAADAREDAAKPIHAPDADDLIAACLYAYNRPYPHVGFNALSEAEQAEWRRHAEGALGDVRAAEKSEGGGHGKA